MATCFLPIIETAHVAEKSHEDYARLYWGVVVLLMIFLDLHGTLAASGYVDCVWTGGVPRLYAERYCLDVDVAKLKVIGEHARASLLV